MVVLLSWVVDTVKGSDVVELLVLSASVEDTVGCEDGVLVVETVVEGNVDVETMDTVVATDGDVNSVLVIGFVS